MSVSTTQIEWVDDEFTILTPGVALLARTGALTLTVNANLTKRRLYAMGFTVETVAGASRIDMLVETWLGGIQVGSFPWWVGNSAGGLNRSSPSLLNATGDDPLADDIQVINDNAGALGVSGAAAVINPLICNIRPLNFKAQIDRVTISILNSVAVSGVRIYAGCFSCNS